MNSMNHDFGPASDLIEQRPVNLSRRDFLGASVGAMVLGVTLPRTKALAQNAAAGAQGAPRVAAFLEIRADSSVLLRSPFVEGGQGISTGFAQIVGEELDADPASFTVECAPPGADYLVLNGNRFTGGSRSMRSSYELMRRVGASARQMLLQAAAARLRVPLASLSTEPGRVRHAASNRTIEYGALASDAAGLPVPENVTLRADKDFRWIGKPVARLDVRDKSTGKAIYGIDLKIDGMLQAAVQHAPRLGLEPAAFANEAEVAAMPGVHSIHRLPGAVAVLGERWWHARRAVETLQVTWKEPTSSNQRSMPADFSSAGRKALLAATPGPGIPAETAGDASAALSNAAQVITASYDAPYLAHGQLEPPSALARWNQDGTLDLWTPNQAPELFQTAVAKVAGIPPEKVKIHSPILGGFFGRHFLYGTDAHPFPQAILLSKAVGRPVKIVWSREEEFLRDALRPMGFVRFRGGLDAKGLPLAFEAETIGEGPAGRWFGRKPDTADRSSVEGIANKPYAIPHRRVAHVPVDDPNVIGFWRSVGHSMNDFFYETFFDELADAGQQDPYELRLRLLADKPRHKRLLEVVGDLSGGWKRGPFTASDGSKRARGVAMASPFGSEVATIAEVSLKSGAVTVHDVWVAIDPGRIVNPAIIEAQVNSAVALGLSSALLEEVVYANGAPQARNFDGYSILPPDRMPRVHVRIVESGAPMGGIGEPGLPGVPPAVVNAIAALTGQRIRSLPLSKFKFGDVG
ncbi:xanthine dehydrogenase family protein molybdopterin-binding subunit [Bradyrhizobium sp. sBnM-33]|uniref:xanthine dehydrogenase family protein molybdopterin-binding subunit n=1 Tax=Bradyrhizobium sp. sBnM-33 TaxID=2831780 RepID=UPI001BCBA3D0|nr:xanthine dehydrogenase family protein molybdopterin-binding subunit [Bradyrhizobium sp. sBnM-33]WOH53367.1 xanthine dehydrogenase family protein molybdopterin-binding subunit [Bradyrhizobium sp. sBnM-33]